MLRSAKAWYPTSRTQALVPRSNPSLQIMSRFRVAFLRCLKRTPGTSRSLLFPLPHRQRVPAPFLGGELLRPLLAGQRIANLPGLALELINAEQRLVLW